MLRGFRSHQMQVSEYDRPYLSARNSARLSIFACSLRERAISVAPLKPASNDELGGFGALREFDGTALQCFGERRTAALLDEFREHFQKLVRLGTF